MEKWWEKEAWRMIQTNMREIDLRDIDAKEYVKQLQKFDATIAMVNAGGILANYPTQVEDIRSIRTCMVTAWSRSLMNAIEPGSG